MKNRKQIILLLSALLFHVSISIGQVKTDDQVEAANRKLLLHIVDALFNKGDTTVVDKYFVAEFAKEE